MTDTKTDPIYQQTDLTATLKPIPDPVGDYCLRCERELPCVCGRLPYVSLFVYDETRHRYALICNVCGVDVQDSPCPLHTPLDVPGLALIACAATPRHERVWMVASDTADYQPCPICLLEQARGEHEGCEHARHGRWRAWRVTRRVVRFLEMTRVTTGHTFVIGGDCPGCVHRVGWRWAR